MMMNQYITTEIATMPIATSAVLRRGARALKKSPAAIREPATTWTIPYVICSLRESKEPPPARFPKP